MKYALTITVLICISTPVMAYENKQLNIDERLVYLLDVYGSDTPTGARPFSVEERTRFVDELSKQDLSYKDSVILERIKNALKAAYCSEKITLSKPFNNWITVGYDKNNSLKPDWYGARPKAGFTSLTFEENASFKNLLRLEIQPRFYLSEDETKAEMVKIMGTFMLGKLGIQAGRSPIWWGYTYYTTLPFSYNAVPLDYVSLVTMDAFQLPWIFKYIGKIKLKIFYSELDDSPRHHPFADEFGYRFTDSFQEGQAYDNPKLIGQRIDFSVTRNFEFSLGKITMFGGIDPNTGNDITSSWGFKEYFNVFFGLDQYYQEPMDVESIGLELEEESNSLGFIDIKWRMPWLARFLKMHYFTVYGSRFGDDADWVYAGGYLPQLDGTGTGINAVGIKTGKGFWNFIAERFNPEDGHFRLYEHGRYKAGQSYKGKWLGCPFGGDSLFYFFRIEHETVANQIGVDFMYGRKKNKSYAVSNSYIEDQSKDIRFHSISTNLTLFNWRHGTLDLQLQGDKITNVDFFEGKESYNFLTTLNYSYMF